MAARLATRTSCLINTYDRTEGGREREIPHLIIVWRVEGVGRRLPFPERPGPRRNTAPFFLRPHRRRAESPVAVPAPPLGARSPLLTTLPLRLLAGSVDRRRLHLLRRHGGAAMVLILGQNERESGGCGVGSQVSSFYYPRFQYCNHSYKKALQVFPFFRFAFTTFKCMPVLYIAYPIFQIILIPCKCNWLLIYKYMTVIKLQVFTSVFLRKFLRTNTRRNV